MQKVFFVLISTLLLCCSIIAQAPSAAQPAKAAASDAKPKKQSFRANKDQIMQVQTMLKAKNLYGGAADGKRNSELSASVKGYQKDNGLKSTGALNRATLEKMGIMLTDTQMTIPIAESSYAATKVKTVKATASTKPTTTDADAKPKRTIFRATKEQVMEAQKLLKTGGMYGGEETGKLDDATRESLKKYQSANNLTATGTLNQATLEKMGIALTDKQKENSMKNSQ